MLKKRYVRARVLHMKQAMTVSDQMREELRAIGIEVDQIVNLLDEGLRKLPPSDD